MAAVVVNKLVNISEYLSPILFPKKPDMIAPINGKNNIRNSILTF